MGNWKGHAPIDRWLYVPKGWIDALTRLSVGGAADRAGAGHKRVRKPGGGKG